MQSAASLLGLRPKPGQSKLLADHVQKGESPIDPYTCTVRARWCSVAALAAGLGPPTGAASRCRRQPACCMLQTDVGPPGPSTPSAQIPLPTLRCKKAGCWS